MDFFDLFMILGFLCIFYEIISSIESPSGISLDDFDKICKNSNVRFSSFEERYDEYKKYCNKIDENEAIFKAVEYWESKMPELNSKYGRNVDGVSMLVAYRVVTEEEPFDLTESAEDIDKQIEEKTKKAYFLAAK